MNTGSTTANVVLVHGGFVDGSGWRAVYDLLTQDGHRVAVVQNPTLTLQGDVAATRLVTDPAWRTRPSWYLVTTEDQMIPPAAQRTMSQRAGSTVVEVAASHSVYLSQPAAVATLIKQAASAVAARQ